MWTLPSYGGVIGGGIGYAAALTPSLLPRTTFFMILVAGLGMAAGYAIGSTVEWVVRSISRFTASYPDRKIVLLSLLAIGIPCAILTPIALGWQYDQQAALNFPRGTPATVALFFGAAFLGLIFVCVGRGFRVITRLLARAIARIPGLSTWASASSGRIRWFRSVVAAAWCVGSIVVFGGAFNAITGSYDSINADSSGQNPVSLGINSGSTGSNTDWETLGREGRFYVNNTMTSPEITGITGRPSSTPVRLYVGMQQAQTPEERVEIALAELERVDAWARPHLAIFGVTGTGWVDPDAINSIEAVTEGDVTTIGVQYSAVPSWIGFLIDPETSMEQNSILIKAVVNRWRSLPSDSRPELILFGESLGSMGTQGAWQAGDQPAAVTQDIQKIVWIGPPAESTLWKSWQAERTSGNAWDPVVGDGSIVQVIIQRETRETANPNQGARIVFAAHANDPVVYWSPSLLLSRPDWAASPLGPGVMPQFRWIPIVTFLQVGLDLVAGGEPPEVGHNYSASMGATVALGIDNPAWTANDLERLSAALPDLRYETG
ncbi:MAG: alpha/beta-hydrolase family protein [Candidatus Nanopelagicales bacterium]|nr:alpha/beta-hydrolase family protein [Candidatus Nanopelagicales bacterium]